MAEGYEIVHDDLKANCARVHWGNYLKINDCKYAIICIDYALMAQYWPAADTTVNVIVYNSEGVFRVSGTNTVSFGNTSPSETIYTINRNGNQMEITTPSNHTMFVIYASA